MKVDIDQIEVSNNPGKNRFEVKLGDQLAVAEYILGNGHIVFAHTDVPREWEGQGVASRLAHTALEYAKANNLEVMLLCPYFAAYMRRHPEYKALLRPGFHV